MLASLACIVNPDDIGEGIDAVSTLAGNADDLATAAAGTLMATDESTSEPELTDETTPIDDPPLRVVYVVDSVLNLWTEGYGAITLYNSDIVSQARISQDGDPAAGLIHGHTGVEPAAGAELFRHPQGAQEDDRTVGPRRPGRPGGYRRSQRLPDDRLGDVGD